MKKKSFKPEVTDLEQAKEVIDFLWQRNIELEDKLNQSSNNSSVPPSKNKPQHQHQTKKKKSDKPQGAQPGHKGSRRMLHPHDERMAVTMYKPASTCHCGGAVICHKKAHQRFQVFDLPELNYTVTEHQAYQGECCHCGEKYSESLPNTVSQTQMGVNLLSFIAIQSAVHHQSIAKIQSMLNDIFGLYFSIGAISEAQGRVSNMLTPTHQAIHEQIKNADLKHADETSYQRNAEKRWMWVALSKVTVFFQSNYFRNKEAAIKLLGEELDGVLVTDQYSSYRYIDDSQRQLCWAHILRNVIAIAESMDKDNQKIGRRLTLIAQALFKTRHRYDDGTLSLIKYKRRIARLQQSWKISVNQGCYQCSKRYKGRCQQLVKDDTMLWTFLNNDAIPMTNNAAERVIRGFVLWRKCSYGVRSHRGELFRQRILSLVETAKLNKINPYLWVKTIVKACIERTDYPIPKFLSG